MSAFEITEEDYPVVEGAPGLDGLGWYFQDGALEFYGPFKNEWEAEKAFSLFLFDRKGLGDQSQLYLNSRKAYQLMKK